MKFSALKANDIGRFGNQGPNFIVISVNSLLGSTEIFYENGVRNNFLWYQFNPEVQYLGKGKVEIKIVKVSD